VTARRIALVWMLVGVATFAIAADEPTIRDIVVDGGVTLTVDTVSYYLGLEPEDPLDREFIIDGYRRLWDSGLFEDILIEIEDHGDDTVTLFVTVVERPFVTTVNFEGNKKIKTSDLKDKLDERGVEVPRNVPLRMAQLSQIENSVKEIYDSEGWRSATVRFNVEDVSPSKKKVVYTITFRNIGDEPADNVVITNPISGDLLYVDGSAFGPGTAIQFSIDGGQTFANASELTVTEDGATRSAVAADFTHIRWVMQQELAVGAQGTARFSAVLE